VSEPTDPRVVRTTVQVDGEAASYLTVEQDGPVVLLLHGTYWSRVWPPVLGHLAKFLGDDAKPDRESGH
jgi:hypothetical protein